MLTPAPPRGDESTLVRAVTFDIGDTLVRTAAGSITKRLAAALAVPLPELRGYLNTDAKRMRQDPRALVQSLCTLFGNGGDRAELEAILRQAADEAAQEPVIYAETIPVIRRLAAAGYYVCAISNLLGAIAPDAEKTRIDLGLHDVVYSCDVGYVKPERGIFQSVERKLCLSGDQILHVGDSWEADVLGATRSGWRALHLRRGNQLPVPVSLPLPGESYPIASLEDLLPVLGNLARPGD